MERALDAGTVVVTERAHVIDHVLKVVGLDLAIEQDLFATAPEARLREATEVHHDLDDVTHALQLAHATGDRRRERVEERLEVVSHRLGQHGVPGRAGDVGAGGGLGPGCGIGLHLGCGDRLGRGLGCGGLGAGRRHGFLRWRGGHQTAGTSEGSATRTSASLTSSETVAMASIPCSSRRWSIGDS